MSSETVGTELASALERAASPADVAAAAADADVIDGATAMSRIDGKPTILVVHASVGSGHRSAAIAVAEAFERLKAEGSPVLAGKGLEDARIEVLDILDFGRVDIDGDKTASMFTGPTRPIYDITWRFTLTGRLLWGGGTVWSYVMFKKFTDFIAACKPVAVVATHITAANSAVSARMLTGQAFPIVCVPTDYETEGFWPHKEADLFCVATESMAETLRPRKVEESRIAITGIPVRGVADAEYDVEQVRRDFGLPLGKTIVLVMAGAHLPQPYVQFRAAMDTVIPLIPDMPDMHFVFLPGRDKEYRTHLLDLQREHWISNMVVMDYVDRMQALMAACDLAICKSGGLTVTECLDMRLPMILLGRSYGQEKVNTIMLTSLGASMHVTTARELSETLRHVHDFPHSLKGLLLNGEILRKPRAAADIAEATIGLVGTTKPRRKHFVQFYWGGKPAHIR